MASGDVAQVIQVLLAAASGDAAARQPAHQQLKDLEDRPGFAGLLLDAYADAAAEPQGRYLAILMCKNVIDRHWQLRGVGKAVAPEEKTQLKDKVMAILRVAVSGGLPHLVELAMVVRRICRFDFPKQWDELARFFIEELQAVQQHGFTDKVLALIVVLHHVLKEQASKRLLSARKDFHQIGQVFAEPLVAVWVKGFELMRQDAGAGNESTWKLSRYLDGCFMLLLAQGFLHLHELPNGPQMIVLAKEKLALLLSKLRAHPAALMQCSFFMKNLKSMMKWWAILLRAHPLAFAQANVGEALRLCVEVLQGHTALRAGGEESRQMAEGLARPALQALTHAFTSVVFRQGPQKAHQGVALEAATACHAQFTAFVQQQGVGSLCELCCCAALQVAAEDVQIWLEDPEDQVTGPGSFTELYTAGEQCIRALGQPPFQQAVVEYVAQRMQLESSRPPTPGDAFEVVAQKDTLLALLNLCQPVLRPHLQFHVLMGFFGPIASMAPQLGGTSAGVLLPVRICTVLKAWTADIPGDFVQPVLQMLHGFLQESCPKAVRLATLGPLRTIRDRFSDNDAWTQLQGPLIDANLVLLRSLKAPETQWRVLNLVHTFLMEEAASGRYEATAGTLEQFMALWNQADQGELLICHALLDVLRSLVLMSCRSRDPRLPLSPPLLSCCLMIISDCITKHGGGSVPVASNEASAALQTDAGLATDSLGDSGGASSTLFDSGSVLFLAVLRTIEVDQAGPLLGLFPHLLSHYSQQQVSALHEHALDLVLEYCALHVAISPTGDSGAQIQPYCPQLLGLCRKCLENLSRDRVCEQSLQILQLLLANVTDPVCVQQLLETVEPLFSRWATTYSPDQAPGSLQYPLHSLLPLLCSCHARHRQPFLQMTSRSPVGAPRIAGLLVTCCKVIRTAAARVAILITALALVEGVGAEEGLWREFFTFSDELITGAQKKGASSVLAQTLQHFKSSLATKLPVPARSAGELQCAMLALELRQSLRADGSLDDVALVRWFFAHLAQTFHQMSAAGKISPQALLSAPDQVQGALRAAGA